MSKSQEQLESLLRGLDGRSYKAYNDLRGSWRIGPIEVGVYHVQGDPFASPSRIEVCVPAAAAAYPRWALSSPQRRIAMRDFVHRECARVCRRFQHSVGTGNGCKVDIARPSQAILDRTAVLLDADDSLRVRLCVGLPARGRSILGREAIRLFTQLLPELFEEGIRFGDDYAEDLREHVEVFEDAEALRAQLAPNGLVAFVADGASLPRMSGVDERPLPAEASVPFTAPPSLQVTLQRPNAGPISGMAIPEGITLIVGGGFHGKSTLLEALQFGVYSHVPGDGREWVITRNDAVKVRAEDGRSIAGTDISAFIGPLPNGSDTSAFSTANASGSTSQAAAIAEALEANARCLLLDEDTSATNFMIRDQRMQALVAPEHEPITPFIQRIEALWLEHKVSTVLVMGGSGAFFDCAHCVIGLQAYKPVDLSSAAKSIAQQFPAPAHPIPDLLLPSPRFPIGSSINPARGRKPVSTRTRSVHSLAFGTEEIDLDAVEQLIEPAQIKAIAAALVQAQSAFANTSLPLHAWLAQLYAQCQAHGVQALANPTDGDFAAFRPTELAAALNRLRSLKILI